MESAIEVVKKELKTFVRRRLPPPPPPSLSSSSSATLNQTPTANPEPLCSNKRTRDLPNFSECHACGFRVDAVDGQSSLNCLYSEWRIVLLCKNCFSLVESSQVCSYCFDHSSSDSFICCDCNRLVHRECFAQYSRVAPWSYSYSGSEFSVCIDCWIPKPIVTARAISKRRKIRLKNIHVSLSDLRSTKVLISRDCRSLSALLKDANCLVEKKLDAAVRAREQALKKAAMARRASQLASHALNFVAQRVESAAEESRKTADNAESAVLLHRAITSSPRFSKNCENTRGDDCDALVGALYNRGFDFFKTPQVLVHNNVCNSSRNAGSSEYSVTAKDHVSPLENRLESIGEDHVPIKANACPVKRDMESESVVLPPKEVLMSAGCNHDMSYSESQPPYKQDKYTQPADERCIEKPYHYFLKYRRRDTTKRYMLKYCKRSSRPKRMPNCKPNVLVDEMCLGIPSSSSSILTSTEILPKISSASFGCCVVPLQACGLDVNAVQEISNRGDR